MRIVTLYNNFYGQRFGDHLRASSPSSWETVSYLFNRRLPPVIDDPEECLPDDLPVGDLLVYVGQDRKIAELIPDVAQLCRFKEVIAAVDNRAFLPSGLAKQIQRRLRAMGIPFVFPAPFCSLTQESSEGDFTREFARLYGQARLDLQMENGTVQAATLHRGAPCGNTQFVVEKLAGVSAQDLVEKAGLLFHAHPCMASMDMDREIGDTILHMAGYLVKEAVRKALGNARCSALCSSTCLEGLP